MTEKAKKRKDTPIYSGVINYFPDAIREVARVSFIGNEQHNPGEPLHWAKGKSMDHKDCLMRHLMDHEGGEVIDDDGAMHLGKVAWRALAALQTYLDKKEAPCTAHNTFSEEEEEAAEKRMNVIGQNGNDGIHYGVDVDGKGYIKYPGDIAITMDQ